MSKEILNLGSVTKSDGCKLLLEELDKEAGSEKERSLQTATQSNRSRSR